MEKYLIFIILVIIFFFNFFLYFNNQKLFKKINLYDYPDNKLKLHETPVFIGGGIMLYLNFLFIYLLNFLFFKFYIMKISVFVIATLIFLLGLFDDKFKLNYLTKFFFLIFFIILLFNFEENILIKNLKFSFTENVLNLGSFSFFFTLLCFLLLLNSINMFDGINLQSGIYFLVFFFFYIITKNQVFLFIIIPLFFFY